MENPENSVLGSTLLNSVIYLTVRLATIAAGLVAILGSILYVKQDSLLYFPEIGGLPRKTSDNPKGYRSPAERNIPYEECHPVASDGTRLHAWLLLKTGPDGQTVPPNTPTVLFFHGNAGNIGLRLPNAMQMLQYCGCNVMLCEYRGYGDSEGFPSEPGLRLDAEACLQYALEHPKIDSSRIFVFGRSLGGAVAFHLADYAQRKGLPLAGVMVENTFLSVSAMVDKLLPFLTPIKPLVLKIGWDSTELVSNLRTPILFLAGDADELVPPEHMQRLIQLATKPPLVLAHRIRGGKHNESWLQGGPAYWDAMRNFMNRAVDADLTNNAASRIATSMISDTGEATVDNVIPTMSSRFVDMAKEAVGSGTTVIDSKKKEI